MAVQLRQPSPRACQLVPAQCSASSLKWTRHRPTSLRRHIVVMPVSAGDAAEYFNTNRVQDAIAGVAAAPESAPCRSDSASDLAAQYHGPALRELDHRLFGRTTSSATLERWRYAYSALLIDAQDLGIPKSALPVLADGASEADIQAAREHVQGMMASFLSANI